MDSAGQALQGMSQTDQDRFRWFFLDKQLINQAVLQDSLLQQLLKQTAQLINQTAMPRQADNEDRQHGCRFREAAKPDRQASQ